jgi:hypothetical protein
MDMAQDRGGGGERDTTLEPFARAASDIKEQAAELADQVGSAAQDLYGQVRDSASRLPMPPEEVVNLLGKALRPSKPLCAKQSKTRLIRPSQ